MGGVREVKVVFTCFCCSLGLFGIGFGGGYGWFV